MTKILPWLLLGTLGFIWGTNFIFMKLAIGVIPPLEVAWLRTVFGALPILAFALVRKSLHWGDWRHLHHFVAMALLANIGPYVGLVVATQHLPSGIVGAASGSIPVITALIVTLLLPSEQLTRWKLIGIVAGFIGVLLVVPLEGQAGNALDEGPWIGLAATLGAATSYALALVYAKRFVSDLGLGAVQLASYQMILASIFLAPFAAPGHWQALGSHLLVLAGLVVGLGLLGTGIAFVIYYNLIARLGALRAASVYYIPPVVALAVGSAFANERVGWEQLVGVLLIVTGVYFSTRPETTVS